MIEGGFESGVLGQRLFRTIAIHEMQDIVEQVFTQCQDDGVVAETDGERQLWAPATAASRLRVAISVPSRVWRLTSSA